MRKLSQEIKKSIERCKIQKKNIEISQNVTAYIGGSFSCTEMLDAFQYCYEQTRA